MALSKCPECNKEVSTSAAICPHCGYPLSHEQPKLDNKDLPIPKNHNWVNYWYKRKKKFVIICCILAPFTLLLSLIFIAFCHVIERKINGYTVLVYCGMGNHIVVEGERVAKIYSSQTVYTNLPDGTSIIVTSNPLDGSADILCENQTISVGQQIIINNVENHIVKKGKQPERSDMEKILIKNAKIDALASIDPTDTKKAKEQIDILNKLDDLD